MAPPTKLEQTPTCWIRGSFGLGRVVMIVKSTLIIDDETAKLRDLMLSTDQAKQYWVFSFSHAFLDYDAATKTFTVTLPAPPTIKRFASDSYDVAEQQLDDWALPDTGVQVARGLRGLQMIGTAD